MKLPEPDSLVVEREKIVDYLLNPQHRFGASKAQFFAAFGFKAEEWGALADAIRRHGREHEVSKVTETRFGPRFEVDGELRTPVGRRPQVRTVWQWDKGQLAPRLITAHPI
ncbi:MAG TPA: hypothetical protein VGL42_13260 [Opitutaceae bacterium]|jgi:hypothetical protein